MRKAEICSMCATLALLAFLPSSFHVAHADSAQSQSCEEHDVSVLRSPDGKWSAKLYGETCDLGLTTSASVNVDLYRSDAPAISQAILGIDMPSRKELWPVLNWNSSSRLAIKLSNRANIGLLVARFQNVEIRAQFCPTTAAERKAWQDYKAAYRQWISGTNEWSAAFRQNPQLAGTKPAAPKPPTNYDEGADCDL